MPTDNQTLSLETDVVFDEIASLFAHGILRLAKGNMLNSMKIYEENSVRPLDSSRNSCMYVTTTTQHE